LSGRTEENYEKNAVTFLTNNISVIKELKNKKSSGLDRISSSLIKKCYIHLIKPLTVIINLSLNSGEFPELFKIAKVRPLLKKGSKYEVENYRPISMISTFSKILEKIVSG
jgi:Notch-like protein